MIETFHLRDWNNWLECLCRLGRLDEAVKLMCVEMAQLAAARPDEDSIKIVIECASRANQEDLTRARIKRYLPDIWSKLPNSIRRETQ